MIPFQQVTHRLEQLLDELCDVFGGRDQLGPAFPMALEMWHQAATRELSKSEFDWQEAQQLLDECVRAVLRSVRFTGPDPLPIGRTS